MKAQIIDPAELSKQLLKLLFELKDATSSLQGSALEKKEKEKETEIEQLIKQAPTIVDMPNKTHEGYIGFTPLAIAAHWGLVSTFALLLKHGAKLDAESHGRNVISNAAYNNKLPILEYLAKNYPKEFEKLVDTFDSTNQLPLYYTLPNNAKDVAIFLMENSLNLTLPHPHTKKLFVDCLDEREKTLSVNDSKKRVKEREELITIIRDTSIQLPLWQKDAVSRFVTNTKNIMPCLESLKDRYAPPTKPGEEKKTQNPEKYKLISVSYIETIFQPLLESKDLLVDTLSKEKLTHILMERYTAVISALKLLQTDPRLNNHSSILSSGYSFLSSTHLPFFAEKMKIMPEIIKNLNEELNVLANPESKKDQLEPEPETKKLCLNNLPQ